MMRAWTPEDGIHADWRDGEISENTAIELLMDLHDWTYLQATSQLAFWREQDTKQ